MMSQLREISNQQTRLLSWERNLLMLSLEIGDGSGNLSFLVRTGMAVLNALKKWRVSSQARDSNQSSSEDVVTSSVVQVE